MKTSSAKLGKSVDIKHLYEVAYRSYSAGKYKDAEDFFRLLTTLDARNTDFWIGLGASLQLQKKYADAVDSFGAAAIMDKEEKNPFSHIHAAECLFALNELPRAQKALKSALLIAKKTKKHEPLIEKIEFLYQRWTNVRDN